MIETGLHIIYNTTARLHYAVDVQETYAGLAVFEPCEPGQGVRDAVDTAVWSEIKGVLEEPITAQNKAGFVDLTGNGTFVPVTCAPSFLQRCAESLGLNLWR